MRRRSFFLVFFLLVSCHTTPSLKLVEPPAHRTLESYQAQAPHAMVVTPNAQATQIGLDILKKGGNAADSAIAISFALSVLRPQSTGIGGGGFLLFYDKSQNKIMALDFRELAPIKATRDMYLRGGKADTKLSQDGALAMAVPRLVAGLGTVYEHYASGKIPWVDLILPAIELAYNGFEVYPHLAKAMEERKNVLARFETSKRIFLSQGKPMPVGDKLVQRDLARTLVLIAKNGWRSFYQGEIPTQIIRTVRGYGGLLMAEDFWNVQASLLEPVEGSYRGFKIISMPPPSSGGVVLIEILNILEEFSLGRLGPAHFKTVHLMTEAMKRGFRDRASYLGDPRFIKVPVRGLLSQDYAQSLAESISLKKATPSTKLVHSFLGPRESDSTTHFSIVDGQGNAIASTQTINYYFGSGLVAAGTGIVLNDEMDDFSAQPGVPNVFGLVGNEANAIEPGKIPLSSMSPTMIFDKKGRLLMVLGAPGGPRMITSVLNTIVNVIDFGASPLTAVGAKRLHHQWLPDTLQTEPDLLPKEIVQKLTGMGHTVEETEMSGLVEMVMKTKEGWVGVSDPRGVGVALGY